MVIKNSLTALVNNYIILVFAIKKITIIFEFSHIVDKYNTYESRHINH